MILLQRHMENYLTFLLMWLSKRNYFIQFFNNAPAISTRFHVLELLPGLGKKMMHDILTERRKQNSLVLRTWLTALIFYETLQN